MKNNNSIAELLENYKRTLQSAKDFPSLLLHNHIICIGYGFTLEYVQNSDNPKLGRMSVSASNYPTQFSKRDADLIAKDLQEKNPGHIIRSMFYLDWYKERIADLEKMLDFSKTHTDII